MGVEVAAWWISQVRGAEAHIQNVSSSEVLFGFYAKNQNYLKQMTMLIGLVALIRFIMVHRDSDT